MPTLFRPSAQSALLGARLFGAAIGFCSQLLLARLLAPADLALFFAATSLAAIAGLICAQGYPAIAARFISRYGERGRQRALSAFVAHARTRTLLASVAAAMAIGTGILLSPLSGDVRVGYLIAAISIPAFASISFYTAFGAAIRRFYSSLLPELVIRPGLFFLILVAFVGTGTSAGGSAMVVSMCAVSAVVALAQWAYLRKWLAAPHVAASRRLARRWRTEAWPLVPVMLFTALFADLAILVQSAFLHGLDLAAFSISIKLALLVGYAVQLAHQFVLPDLSDAYARRDRTGIRRRLIRAAAMPLLVSLLALVATMAFGEKLLGLFGPQFAYASGPLALMIGCQLLRAAAGPTTNLLTLEGAQRANALICGFATIVLVAASAVLAPAFGLWGAAWALAISYVAWLGASAILLHRLSGLRADLPALLAGFAAERNAAPLAAGR